MDDNRPKDAAPKLQTFSYRKPDNLRNGKGIVQLAQSDIIRGRVQIVREGGENNLHSHTGMDGFWFVLAGKVWWPQTVALLLGGLAGGYFGARIGQALPAVATRRVIVAITVVMTAAFFWRAYA